MFFRKVCESFLNSSSAIYLSIAGSLKKQVLTIWPVIYLKNNQIEQNDGFNAEKRNVQIQNQSIADALQNRCS